jgi:hypothetical protein
MQVQNLDWRTKSIAIKDRTVIQRYLPKKIATSLCMYRKMSKIWNTLTLLRRSPEPTTKPSYLGGEWA